MVNNRQDIEALIVLFLRGEASPDQAEFILDWRKDSEENDALFTSIEKLYHAANQSKMYEEVDVAKAWRNVSPQLINEPKVIPLWKNPMIYIGAAAIALIAFIVGSIWSGDSSNPSMISDYDPSDSTQVQQHTLYAQHFDERFVLTDSSFVALKKGSKVEVLAGFNKDDRQLKLEGSGEFFVQHDKDRPFSVQIERMRVLDIGTVFSITNQGDTIRVVVSEGEVQLQLNGDVLNVSAGDSAFYVISQDLIDRYKTKEVRQDKVFEFNGTALSEVVHILGEFFDQEIVIMNDEIKECPLSVTFKDEDLVTILDIISELLDLRILRNNEKIEIYGKGC